MTEELKINARKAMMTSKKTSIISSLIMFLVIISVWLIVIFVKPDIIWRALLSVLLFILKAVVDLYVQVKLILSAKERSGKTGINAKYMLKACSLKLLVLLFELKDIILYELLTLFSGLSLFIAVRNSWLSINAFYAAFAGVVLLFIVGIWFVHLSFQRYSKAMFFLAAYPLLSAKEALKLSCRDDEKSDRRLTAFKASFLPWFIACLFILPIPFVVSYYKQSITCYFLSR